MFHIKNDKRSQSSSQAIYQGLISLSKQRPFNSITVSAICEESKVSRATFYRNFDIIEDIFMWRIDDISKDILDKYQGRPEHQKDMTFNRFVMRIGFEHYELLKALNDAHRLDLIENAIRHFIEMYGLTTVQKIDSKLLKYALASKIGSFFGILECWINNEQDLDLNAFLDNLDKITEIAEGLTIVL